MIIPWLIKQKNKKNNPPLMGFIIVKTKNMTPLHPRMLCVKFGWNWPINWLYFFKISSMYFCYFFITSPRKACLQTDRQTENRRSEKLTWAVSIFTGKITKVRGLCIFTSIFGLSSRYSVHCICKKSSLTTAFWIDAIGNYWAKTIFNNL